MDKTKAITLLVGKILGYKNPMTIENLKYRQRIIFDNNSVLLLMRKELW
ncbi:MAG: hypothetical protein HZR80_00900 [Candidatus Heimdallarchaeota archaeon]